MKIYIGIHMQIGIRERESIGGEYRGRVSVGYEESHGGGGEVASVVINERMREIFVGMRV